jgi:hypothetical protein
MINIDLQKIPSLIVTYCVLHNIVINVNHIIDEVLGLKDHHDEGYTAIVDHTAPEDKVGQLQLQNICIFLKLRASINK